MNILAWLQNWYQEYCDGEWEHGYRIRITTLDNPGWGLEVNLEDTKLEFQPFEKVSVERNENDWLYCFIENKRFNGAGGPTNLVEILEIFRNWVINETSFD